MNLFTQKQNNLPPQRRNTHKSVGGTGDDPHRTHPRNRVPVARGAIGTPEHAKQYFQNSGFPQEYFNHTLQDVSYIDIAPNITNSLATAEQKITTKIKLLNYLYHIEHKLEANEDLTAFRKQCIADYRKAIDVHLEPPALKKMTIQKFNRGQLHNRSHQHSTKNDDENDHVDDSTDASYRNHSYVAFLLGYETTREDRRHDTNIDEYCYGREKDKDYIRTVERLTKISSSDLHGKIKASNYHPFHIRWNKVRDAITHITPHSDVLHLEDDVIDEHPLHTYWLKRHQQIQEYFNTQFGKLKGVAMPQTIREEQAVCRSDQRQLLMLLCGDVPADMFVNPHTGHIRNEQQISHHILFLTKPYHMSNTFLGVLLQNVNRFINTIRHGGVSFAKALGWSLLTLLQVIGMFSAVLVLYKDNHTHIFAQNVAFVLAYLLKTLVQLVLKTTGLSRSKIRAYSIVYDVDETMRILQTAGASYFVWRILWTLEKDVHHNMRLHVMQIPLQRAIDYFNLTRAMEWLAQLKPGVLGGSTPSGISDEQLGQMQLVQNEMKELDIEIIKTRRANVEQYMEKYEKSEKSRSRKMLWADLNADYHAARANYVNPRQMRKKYMGKYPHEFRAHHFFDSYGNTRNPLQIVLAYFCYWEREERECTIPVVPYNSNTLHEYLHPDEISPAKKLQRSRTLKGSIVHLNPIQRSEFYRRAPFNGPDVADSTERVDNRAQFNNDIHERTDHEVGKNIRAHIDLQDIFKHERHYTAWLESNLPNNDSAREEFRKIKGGWTHKLSPAIRSRLRSEFHLSTRRAVVDYKEFAERQLRLLDRNADAAASGETPWYIIGNDNVYNLFTGPQIENNYDDYESFVNSVYETYKTKINEKRGSERLNDEQLLTKMVVQLKRQPQMATIHTSLPVANQRATYLLQNNGFAVKEAVVNMLGVYLYTIDEPTVLRTRIDKVLNHRLSAQHRSEIGALFRHQFITEDDFLKEFVVDSNMVHLLQVWYEETNNQLGGGKITRRTQKKNGSQHTTQKKQRHTQQPTS